MCFDEMTLTWVCSGYGSDCRQRQVPCSGWFERHCLGFEAAVFKWNGSSTSKACKSADVELLLDIIRFPCVARGRDVSLANCERFLDHQKTSSFSVAQLSRAVYSYEIAPVFVDAYTFRAVRCVFSVWLLSCSVLVRNPLRCLIILITYILHRDEFCCI